MRCSDVDAIIDDHRIRTLGAAERSAVDAHLEGCRRCAGAWLTNEALLGERIAAAPAGLLAATLSRVRARAATEPARRTPSWPAAAGLAAIFVVVAMFALLALRPPEIDAPATASARPSAGGLVEGRDYRRLAGRPQTASSDAPVEVVELFTYDCRRCYAFEPRLAAWFDAHADEIALLRIPVQWTPGAERHARAFYAAAALGSIDDMQRAFFDEIHARGNRLDSDEALAALFARFGIERAAFEQTYTSAAVEARTARARALADGFGITSIPAVVVGGELVTDGAMVPAPDRLVEVVEQLVKCVEEQRRTAAAPAERHC